ncbi:MAG: DUF2333 family protein [Pseudomonadota bacterium]
MLTRFFDWLVEFWDRLRGMLGLHRLTKKGRGADLEGVTVLKRIVYFGRPILVLLSLVYVGTMIWRFSFVRGYDLGYPQEVLTAPAVSGIETAAAGQGEATGRTCAPSRIVQMQQALIDMLVNQNDWAPATPQYRIGVFGLLPWSQTPFFDNKASFQVGVLTALRRVSIELTDTLGRVRGTSGADPDLEAARGELQRDELTWVINPFDDRRPFISDTAASSYRNAISLFERYNGRLAACDALFDARADNLFQLFDRITKDLGSTVDQIASRSQGEVYDVETHSFVDGDGNDWGWFDMRADNLFHEASGKMYAYHGILQAAREDFAEVIRNRNIGDVWDRMEAHTAEAAALSPLIVSNGREDGFAMPDHLSVMAENILSARANMTEIREILDR